MNRTGKPTRVVDLFPPAPADHPIFKRGFVIGTTRSADFSRTGATPPSGPEPSAKPAVPSQEEPMEKLAEEAKAFLERKRRQQRSNKLKAAPTPANRSAPGADPKT